MSDRHSGDGYAFLDDIAIADIAFRARGADLASLFTNSARATTATMVEDFDTIRTSQIKTIEMQANEPDLLLFDLLQELIYYKDAERLILLPAEIVVETGDNSYRLRGEFRGEPLDPSRHPTNADVKAVTLHRFEVLKSKDGWQATVVLDV